MTYQKVGLLHDTIEMSDFVQEVVNLVLLRQGAQRGRGSDSRGKLTPLPIGWQLAEPLCFTPFTGLWFAIARLGRRRINFELHQMQP